MSAAASYILTVTAAAMLTAIAVNLAGSGSMSALVRLIAGIFMAVTVLSPLMKIELPDPADWFHDLELAGEQAAAEGSQMAKEARRVIIKEELEAYIQDKALDCGADLTVDVTLDDSDVPIHILLTGAVPGDVRSRLSKSIETELGLGEEAQEWNS